MTVGSQHKMYFSLLRIVVVQIAQSGTPTGDAKEDMTGGTQHKKEDFSCRDYTLLQYHAHNTGFFQGTKMI